MTATPQGELAQFSSRIMALEANPNPVEAQILLIWLNENGLTRLGAGLRTFLTRITQGAAPPPPGRPTLPPRPGTATVPSTPGKPLPLPLPLPAEFKEIKRPLPSVRGAPTLPFPVEFKEVKRPSPSAQALPLPTALERKTQPEVKAPVAALPQAVLPKSPLPALPSVTPQQATLPIPGLPVSLPPTSASPDIVVAFEYGGETADVDVSPEDTVAEAFDKGMSSLGLDPETVAPQNDLWTQNWDGNFFETWFNLSDEEREAEPIRLISTE